MSTLNLSLKPRSFQFAFGHQVEAKVELDAHRVTNLTGDATLKWVETYLTNLAQMPHFQRRIQSGQDFSDRVRVVHDGVEHDLGLLKIRLPARIWKLKEESAWKVQRTFDYTVTAEATRLAQAHKAESQKATLPAMDLIDSAKAKILTHAIRQEEAGLAGTAKSIRLTESQEESLAVHGNIRLGVVKVGEEDRMVICAPRWRWLRDIWGDAGALGVPGRVEEEIITTVQRRINLGKMLVVMIFFPVVIAWKLIKWVANITIHQKIIDRMRLVTLGTGPNYQDFINKQAGKKTTHLRADLADIFNQLAKEVEQEKEPSKEDLATVSSFVMSRYHDHMVRRVEKRIGPWAALWRTIMGESASDAAARARKAVLADDVPTQLAYENALNALASKMGTAAHIPEVGSDNASCGLALRAWMRDKITNYQFAADDLAKLEALRADIHGRIEALAIAKDTPWAGLVQYSASLSSSDEDCSRLLVKASRKFLLDPRVRELRTLLEMTEAAIHLISKEPQKGVELNLVYQGYLNYGQMVYCELDRHFCVWAFNHHIAPSLTHLDDFNQFMATFAIYKMSPVAPNKAILERYPLVRCCVQNEFDHASPLPDTDRKRYEREVSALAYLQHTRNVANEFSEWYRFTAVLEHDAGAKAHFLSPVNDKGEAIGKGHSFLVGVGSEPLSDLSGYRERVSRSGLSDDFSWDVTRTAADKRKVRHPEKGDLRFTNGEVLNQLLSDAPGKVILTGHSYGAILMTGVLDKAHMSKVKAAYLYGTPGVTQKDRIRFMENCLFYFKYDYVPQAVVRQLYDLSAFTGDEAGVVCRQLAKYLTRRASHEGFKSFKALEHLLRDEVACARESGLPLETWQKLRKQGLNDSQRSHLSAAMQFWLSNKFASVRSEMEAAGIAVANDLPHVHDLTTEFDPVGWMGNSPYHLGEMLPKDLERYGAIADKTFLVMQTRYHKEGSPNLQARHNNTFFRNAMVLTGASRFSINMRPQNGVSYKFGRLIGQTLWVVSSPVRWIITLITRNILEPMKRQWGGVTWHAAYGAGPDRRRGFNVVQVLKLKPAEKAPERPASPAPASEAARIRSIEVRKETDRSAQLLAADILCSQAKSQPRYGIMESINLSFNVAAARQHADSLAGLCQSISELEGSEEAMTPQSGKRLAVIRTPSGASRAAVSVPRCKPFREVMRLNRELGLDSLAEDAAYGAFPRWVLVAMAVAAVFVGPLVLIIPAARAFIKDLWQRKVVARVQLTTIGEGPELDRLERMMSEENRPAPEGKPTCWQRIKSWVKSHRLGASSRVRNLRASTSLGDVYTHAQNLLTEERQVFDLRQSCADKKILHPEALLNDGDAQKAQLAVWATYTRHSRMVRRFTKVAPGVLGLLSTERFTSAEKLRRQMQERDSSTQAYADLMSQIQLESVELVIPTQADLAARRSRFSTLGEKIRLLMQEIELLQQQESINQAGIDERLRQIDELAPDYQSAYSELHQPTKGIAAQICAVRKMMESPESIDRVALENLRAAVHQYIKDVALDKNASWSAQVASCLKGDLSSPKTHGLLNQAMNSFECDPLVRALRSLLELTEGALVLQAGGDVEAAINHGQFVYAELGRHFKLWAFNQHVAPRCKTMSHFSEVVSTFGIYHFGPQTPDAAVLARYPELECFVDSVFDRSKPCKTVVNQCYRNEHVMRQTDALAHTAKDASYTAKYRFTDSVQTEKGSVAFILQPTDGDVNKSALMIGVGIEFYSGISQAKGYLAPFTARNALTEDPAQAMVHNKLDDGKDTAGSYLLRRMREIKHPMTLLGHSAGASFMQGLTTQSRFPMSKFKGVYSFGALGISERAACSYLVNMRKYFVGDLAKKLIEKADATNTHIMAAKTLLGEECHAALLRSHLELAGIDVASSLPVCESLCTRGDLISWGGVQNYQLGDTKLDWHEEFDAISRGVSRVLVAPYYRNGSLNLTERHYATIWDHAVVFSGNSGATISQRFFRGQLTIGGKVAAKSAWKALFIGRQVAAYVISYPILEPLRRLWGKSLDAAYNKKRQYNVAVHV